MFMSNPLKQHFIATNRIMRYINDTLHYGLVFRLVKGNTMLELIGFFILIGVVTRFIEEVTLDTSSNS